MLKAALKQPTKLFGSAVRTRVLVAICLLEETFPAELTRLLNANLITIQRILNGLELESLVVSRKLGVERRITLNPRYYAAKELRALLLKLSEQDVELQSALSQRRSRPRRRGKEI